MDPEFNKDLRWLERFLPLYNCVSQYDHQQYDHHIHLDTGTYWNLTESGIPSPNPVWLQSFEYCTPRNG